MAIVDPGQQATQDRDLEYVLAFTNPHQRIGFGVHDQAADFLVRFERNGSSVGSIGVDCGTADLSMFYFSNTDLFDLIKISIKAEWPKGKKVSGGFAIDTITLDGHAVPEPASYLLIGCGFVLLSCLRKRRVR